MKKQNKFIIAGFALSLLLAGVVSNYASSSPDGLEKVADALVLKYSYGVKNDGCILAFAAK